MHTDIIKWIHILSATVLMGTGLGIAYFKWASDRLTDVVAIDHVNRLVVQADGLFTTPAIVLQVITGVLLMQPTGHSMDDPWLMLSIGLFLVAGACWLPVVYLQIRMRHLSHQAVMHSQPLTSDYFHLARYWFWLGVPAFVSVVAVFYLMAVNPTLPI